MAERAHEVSAAKTASTQVGACSYQVQRRPSAAKQSPQRGGIYERNRCGTVVQESSSQHQGRILQSCSSSYQVRQIVFREISAYSKVAVRPKHCCRCGIIQQLFTAHIEERLHQHINTHNVATLAKTTAWFNGKTIRSIATARHGSKVHFNVSIPSIYNILTGQEKHHPTVGTKLDTITKGHSISRTMHAAIPSASNNPSFAFQAFTIGPGEASIAVYTFTRGQLRDTVADIFIKHMANGYGS